MRALIIFLIFFASSVNANININCIMVHDEDREEVVKKSVSLESSDGLVNLYDFNHVMVSIKPHAVVNINDKNEIYSFLVVLKSNKGYTATAIAEEVFNGDSSVSISLSNENWSLLTECYQVQ